jgi:hypothetical protein
MIMIVMGAAELTFNATAFRLIEAGQDYQSYIMALAPTLSLLMMAHFLGVKWRQWAPQTLWRNMMIAVAIFITITVAAWALGIMRAEFVEVKAAEAMARAATDQLQTAQDEKASLERQVEQRQQALRGARASEAARAELSAAEQALAQKSVEEKTLSDRSVAAKEKLGEARRGLVKPNLTHVWLLFAINMLILMTGAFASYYSHDADYDLERIVAQKMRVRRELMRWWKKWGRASARYDRVIKTARERINHIVHAFEAIVGEYRWYNTRERQAYPSYFRTDFSGKPYLVRAFGHETERAPQDLREAFDRIERELVDPGAAAPLTAVSGGKHA